MRKRVGNEGGTDGAKRTRRCSRRTVPDDRGTFAIASARSPTIHSKILMTRMFIPGIYTPATAFNIYFKAVNVTYPLIE